MTKILLVEDQPTAAAYLAKGLKEEGMMVDVAHNGPDGLHLLLTVQYDLAILDVMLPGLDGWTILETMRRAQRQTPVLFVTARDAIDDRVRGLELGAEDYMVKPFAFSELLARVRVILRRSGRLRQRTSRPCSSCMISGSTSSSIVPRAAPTGSN